MPLLGYTLILSQAKYIRDILHKADLADAKAISTALPANLKLTRFGSDYLDDSSHYKSIVGALQYVMTTRPEIGYAITTLITMTCVTTKLFEDFIEMIEVPNNKNRR